MRRRIRSSLCLVFLVTAGVRCAGDAFTLSNDGPQGNTPGVDAGPVDATSPGDGQVDGGGPKDSGLDGPDDSSSSGEDGKAEGGQNPDASQDGGQGQDASGVDGGREDAGDGSRPDAGEADGGACTLCGTTCCAAGEVCCPTVVILLDGGSLAKDVCQASGIACIVSGAPAN
jgi:hypothetical protein